MPETVLAVNDAGAPLVEWRDPLRHIVEWVELRGNETRVLFRWEGTAGINASLFPATRYRDGNWSLNLPILRTALLRLVQKWAAPDLLDAWLEVCRRWAPSDRWMPGAWPTAVKQTCLPWLADQRFSYLSVPKELRPFFQASTPRDGLVGLGFRVVGKKLLSLVLRDLEEDLKRPGALVVSTRLLWAWRCQKWLTVDELYRFWTVPASEYFFYCFMKRESKIAGKLIHPLGNGKIDCALYRFPSEWSERGLELLPIEPFEWSATVRQRYAVRRGNWETRLPYDYAEIVWWGYLLDNRFREVDPELYSPERSILVGLFRDGILAAMAEWEAGGKLVYCRGFQNRRPRRKKIQMFRKLLPEVAMISPIRGIPSTAERGWIMVTA